MYLAHVCVLVNESPTCTTTLTTTACCPHGREREPDAYVAALARVLVVCRLLIVQLQELLVVMWQWRPKSLCTLLAAWLIFPFPREKGGLASEWLPIWGQDVLFNIFTIEHHISSLHTVAYS